MSSKFPNLLSGIEIKGNRLKNRVFFAATHTALANADGSVTEALLAWINARAKGGVGMIVSESIRTSDMFGSDFAYLPSIHDDKKQAGWRKYVQYCQYWGAITVAQLNIGAGKQANPGFGEFVAPSPLALEIPLDTADTGLKILEGLKTPVPREITGNECELIIEDFKKAAQRVKNCGFDGLEIHGSHGYLLSQFISPLHNKRNDDFGGSFEKRLTLPLALLKAAREICGDNMIIGFRLSSNDYAAGGYGVKEYLRCAKILQDNGLDYISLTMGGMWKLSKAYPGKPGVMLEEHSQFKEELNIPVLSPNFHSPLAAEKALEAGKVDMIGLSRSLIADPFWVRKVEKNNERHITRCHLCNTCIIQLVSCFQIQCTVNQDAGWEKYHPEYWPPPRLCLEPIHWKKSH